MPDGKEGYAFYRNNLSVIASQCHCPGCGTQHPQRFACVLLAAAPTATPCFRHWRRSPLLLLSRGGLGIAGNFISSPEAPLQGATTTTAASGGSRESLLGQRPARRKRSAADAGCRNPGAKHLWRDGQAHAGRAKFLYIENSSALLQRAGSSLYNLSVTPAACHLSL